MVGFQKRFSKYSVSGSPSIFLISTKYRLNYLVRSTIVLSAAQENSVLYSLEIKKYETAEQVVFWLLIIVLEVKSSGNHFHFLKEPFARFRFTITELKYRALCVRKTWRSFLPQMSHLSQSVKGKIIFWRLDPLWSPGCPNSRVESNDVKLIFIFVLFNKYYCVLLQNFVTYSTATQIHRSLLHVKQLWQLQAKYPKASNFKIHMLVYYLLCAFPTS